MERILTTHACCPQTYAACTGFFTGAAISYLVLEEVNAGPQGPLPNYEWVQIISAAASGKEEGRGTTDLPDCRSDVFLCPSLYWYSAGLIGMLLFSCLIRIVIVGLGLLLGLFVSVRELALPPYSCRLSCTS